MQFESQLQAATLVRRYKRFLADVILTDGTQITVHVANTGAMTHCGAPGDTIWLSDSNNSKRKYRYSWEYSQNAAGDLICVNTQRANQIVKEALLTKQIAPLSDYDKIASEVKYGSENSRIDFLLSHPEQVDCYVEVKSVTLLEGGQGWFPDTQTVRGQKHLRELMEIKKAGARAVLLFAVMHSGIKQVSAAKHLDPIYTELIDQATACGVEIYTYGAQLDIEQMSLAHKLCWLNKP
ncbi:DNA/RNA nuclease SfsA [Motilimonas eburnea]|uniref:DNA/RNA nuclease SfsA n=1 Tax=Motilimonas eburnea TaxID=1737488 RepID=UPI001E342A1E|nr:DNA/RNA nuclease SfsA [Motilimonas eburnea]